ncbi:G-type lectin S-receptor-like serine/threonine-protein kinase At1g11330 isoform X1 [Rhododendron vialii]|uniref:G-type lectin S-receptor-like serine/threonine-protein kinase At1g11330 isoform X1 n=1 Tax=Rhododendron vialii TaxID=182163 RepID=UPI00265F2B04|nr:G-type lectin S-receptor-like serine/threonine-protein kinase At1g11330 isoform X1 [Rhododendron vialii]
MTNFAHSVFFLIFSFSVFANSLTDTILQGQLVRASTTITSSGDEFELGFFIRSEYSTINSYLGVWYKRVSVQTVVWVANRDYPFAGSSAVLTIAVDGNLVIKQGRITYMLSNISSSGNTSATLMDSGNLVLVDTRSGDLLWQSFDYPSDTLLPGMKLGHDKRNGKTWSLLAWKSKEDPGPGGFSIALDPQGTNQFFILKGFQKYWTGGTWKGQIFALIPEMGENFVFKCTYISNENESYFTYSMRNPSVTGRLVMDISGQIQALIWVETIGEWNLFWDQPREQCDVYAYCGAFGSCYQNPIPFCQCFRGFQPKSIGNWNAGNTSGGCVRKTPLQCGNDSEVNGQKDQFLWISKVGLPDNPIVLSQVRSVGDCESACFTNCPCSAYNYDGNDGCSIWHEELLNVEQLIDDDPEGRDFYLRLAASEFLREGKDPRIKRRKWIILALAVPTTLLVTVGFFYCLWRQKSRNKDPMKYGILSWELRVNIIEGIAQGLLYLHQYSRLRIIHRDLKPSNILLDEDMNPKISDFGMARIFGGNGSQATNRIVGTYGYMSPKYALDGLFSIKSDVFSFGVLLLEILSGKRSTRFYSSNSVNLLGYAWDLWKSGRGEGIKDPILQDIPSTNTLLRYVNIALLCVQESAADRPTMSNVVSMLSNELVLPASPKQPAFSNGRSVPDQNSAKQLKICSITDETVSILEGR